MSAPTSHKVLRVAVIVDGESCEELHQREPGDIEVVRGSDAGIGIGPSSPLEYGAAAEAPKGAQLAPLSLIIFGLLLLLGAGGWFVSEVRSHMSENAVLEGPTAAVEGEEDPNEGNGTLALVLAMLGVIPLVTGTSMLNGRGRVQRQQQQLTVYDGHVQPHDYRKRAPIWLGVGAVLVLGGSALFAHEVSQHDPDAPITDATRGDMTAFKQVDKDGTGGLGLIIALAGLVPLVIGVMGLQEAPVEAPKRKVKGGHAPRQHKLFEWVEGEGTYYINIPADARGKIALGKNKATVEALRKRFGQPDGNLRVKLGGAAKGRLLIGQTRVVFKTAKPAKAAPLPVFPAEFADPFAHLRLSHLDLAAFGAAGAVALILAVWFMFFSDRKPSPPDERFVREMGIPASFYEEEKPKEEEAEDTLKQKDEKEKEEEKKEEEKELDEKLQKPENISDKAFQEARGVGVARVLGTYGGPGEGTVLDVIESTENNLGDLFAQGMTSTDEYRGGEIGDFVAGGGGIESTGTLTKNEALQTGEGPAEVGKTDKKERKVKGSASSNTGDVFGADKKAVSATIRQRMPGLQACYEKALRSNGSLKGKMGFAIVINTSGRVTKVDIEEDTVNDPSVRSCTVAKIKGWRFLVADDAEDSAEVAFSVTFA
ncbi:MAG: AgmX/PglI C-terminal domain-containing protein, partial [Myxococcales bacterium]|nr:AgmX/PglI C-terminal domain-containing protein [Myxococcales bacterium]